MQVIGHDHEFVEYNRSKMGRNYNPTFSDQSSEASFFHQAFADPTEDVFAAVGADGHEISVGKCVVATLEANRPSMEILRSHNR